MTQLEMPKQTEGRGHNSGIQNLNQVTLAQQPSEPANETGRDYLGFVVSVRCLATNQVQPAPELSKGNIQAFLEDFTGRNLSLGNLTI